MNSPATPVPRLVAIDRRQLLLRTVDVEKFSGRRHSGALHLGVVSGAWICACINAQIARREAARDASTPTRSC